MNNKTAPGAPALRNLVIALKGGGDLATGVALRLFRAGFTRLYIMEIPAPTVLRRKVAFASAVYETAIEVEGVRAVRLEDPARIFDIWAQGSIPVLPDPDWNALAACPPHVLVDGIMAKRNLGTRIGDAKLIIGLGPGFNAGEDVHQVIETRRGHELGRIITHGCASVNTSLPESVLGITADRLLRAPCPGTFIGTATIGDRVVPGQVLGHVDGCPVKTKIAGIIRGLVHDGVKVAQNRKIGDVDPTRGEAIYCHTVSDKARALGGGVLEAILGRFNR